MLPAPGTAPARPVRLVVKALGKVVGLHPLLHLLLAIIEDAVDGVRLDGFAVDVVNDVAKRLARSGRRSGSGAIPKECSRGICFTAVFDIEDSMSSETGDGS
jgi:hypothetical protein